jgi:hypothetical protein
LCSCLVQTGEDTARLTGLARDLVSVASFGVEIDRGVQVLAPTVGQRISAVDP